MEEPREELRAEADERTNPPDFDALTPPEELVRGERTRDDFFDTVLTLTTPATVSEVAERAGHGVDAAREYLEWFERLGVVHQRTESPATYERNQEYLDWRRVQTLREEYTAEELLDRLEHETDRVAEFRADLGVESPEEISLSAHAADTDRSVEEVWETVTAWKTARARITLLERALQDESGDAAERQPAV
jgi:hypothetical protein